MPALSRARPSCHSDAWRWFSVRSAAHRAVGVSTRLHLAPTGRDDPPELSRECLSTPLPQLPSLAPLLARPLGSPAQLSSRRLQTRFPAQSRSQGSSELLLLVSKF